MHDGLIDDVIPDLGSRDAASEPRLAAGTINRISGSGSGVKVWAIIDGFDGYEWGPLEHRPFAPGETPLVGARCAIGIFSDEKWLVGLDETAVTAATWYTGATAPAAGLGSEGDLYLDTTANAWYGPKHLGAWGSAHALTRIPAFLVGTGAPSAGTGVDGDAYIDRSTGLLYAPKATGAWPAGALLPPGLTFTAKSATYTAVSGDYVIATGSFVVTLPTPTAGRVVGVRSVNGTGAAPVTISTPSGAILGKGVPAGGTAILLGTPGANVQLQADGTNWHVIAGEQDSGWIAFPYAAFWHDFSGGNYQLGGYRKVAGIVSFRGLVQINTGGGATIGTIPAGYRPPRDCNSFVCKSALDAATNGYSLVDVNAGTGVVLISVLGQTLSPNGNISLDQISYDTNP